MNTKTTIDLRPLLCSLLNLTLFTVVIKTPPVLIEWKIPRIFFGLTKSQLHNSRIQDPVTLLFIVTALLFMVIALLFMVKLHVVYCRNMLQLEKVL